MRAGPHEYCNLMRFFRLEGDTLTIWGGERGSPAYAESKFSEDGNTGSGEWVYPGGGYRFTMTRVK